MTTYLEYTNIKDFYQKIDEIKKERYDDIFNKYNIVLDLKEWNRRTIIDKEIIFNGTLTIKFSYLSKKYDDIIKIKGMFDIDKLIIYSNGGINIDLYSYVSHIEIINNYYDLYNKIKKNHNFKDRPLHYYLDDYKNDKQNIINLKGNFNNLKTLKLCNITHINYGCLTNNDFDVYYKKNKDDNYRFLMKIYNSNNIYKKINIHKLIDKKTYIEKKINTDNNILKVSNKNNFIFGRKDLKIIQIKITKKIKERNIELINTFNNNLLILGKFNDLILNGEFKGINDNLDCKNIIFNRFKFIDDIINLNNLELLKYKLEFLNNKNITLSIFNDELYNVNNIYYYIVRYCNIKTLTIINYNKSFNLIGDFSNIENIEINNKYKSTNMCIYSYTINKMSINRGKKLNIKLKSINDLTINNINVVNDMNIKHIKNLYLSKCSKIKNIKDISNNIENINVSDFDELKKQLINKINYLNYKQFQDFKNYLIKKN